MLIGQGAATSTLPGCTLMDGDIINLQASQNDFDPPCMKEATSVHINAQVAGLSITGLARPRAGRQLRVYGANATNSFTLVSGSGASQADHVLNLGGNIIVAPGTVVDLYCPQGDGATGWYLASSSIASGGGGSGTVTSVSVPDDFVVATASTTPAISHGALVTIAAAAGASNDVNPGGGWPVGYDRIDVTLAAGNANFTGLLAGQDGQVVIIANPDATNNLTLNAQNVGSAAANRFRAAADITLTPGGAIIAKYYAGTVNRWQLIP